jgi:hypothetical protein
VKRGMVGERIFLFLGMEMTSRVVGGCNESSRSMNRDFLKRLIGFERSETMVKVQTRL